METVDGANADKNQSRVNAGYTDEVHSGQASRGTGDTVDEALPVAGGEQYKVYKVRWFGLAQLVLLNIVVSWDVSFPPFRQSQRRADQ